jgi:D-alanine-D-alanine ligase
MAPRKRKLVVACTVDTDVYRQLSTRKAVFDRAKCDLAVMEAIERLYGAVHLVSVGDDLGRVLDQIRALAPDVVFNLAQATLDREPAFAGVLEYLRIAFTGSGLYGIALSRDKIRSRELLRAAGVPVPRFVEILPGDGVAKIDLTPPLFVKPAKLGGCSFGIYRDSLVTTPKAAIGCARRLWKRYAMTSVCDEFIIGRELRVGILEDVARRRFRIVGITESLFPRSAPGWGFKSQGIRVNPRVREAQGVESIVPSLPRALLAELRAIADTSCRVLDMRGYASLDVRIDDRGRCVVLEVNANPGLSTRSRIWGRPSLAANIRTIVEAALPR